MKQKYMIIYETLNKQLEDGIYKVGDMLPTENELCQVFDTSRMTVNKVLTMLAQEGRVERIRGKGTFVNDQLVDKEIIRLTSFTEDMKAIGKTPGSKLLEYTLMYDVPKKFREILNLDDQDYVHVIKRIRTADGEIIALDISYISSKLVPMLNIKQLNESLYKYVEDQLKVKLLYSDVEIKVKSADKDVAHQLKINPSDSVISLKHTTYTEDQQIFEYCRTYYRADRYSFKLKAYR